MSSSGETTTDVGGILPAFRSKIIDFLKNKNLQAITKDLFSRNLIDSKAKKFVSLDSKKSKEKRKKIVEGVIASVDSDIDQFLKFLEVILGYKSEEDDKDFLEKLESKCSLVRSENFLI